MCVNSPIFGNGQGDSFLSPWLVPSAKETGGDSPATYLYTYDAIGNLVASEKKDQTGKTVFRVYQNYDSAGQLVGQTWYAGNTGYSESYTYNPEDGSLSSMSTGTGETVQYSYDQLQRLTGADNGLYTKNYTYRRLPINRTTNQITQVQYTGLPTALTYSYTYNALGNISSYTAPGKSKVTYTYDALGQLLSAVGDQTYIYTYDSVGNILTANGHTYTCGSSYWKDLLTAYDGQAITYDDSGNPASYFNGTRWSFDWENGRNLVYANNGTTRITYAYDANGLRTGKTVGDVTHNYLYASGQLLRETYGSNTLDFFYDTAGYPYALKHNGTTYYYITNLQGDVMYLVDAQGNTVASYDYDPYGNIISATGAMAEINPLRYRGYYYDTELKMYYLQSRYYDPQIGRFINADDVSMLGASGTALGYNLFAYCENNPISFKDKTGYLVVSAVVGAVFAVVTTYLLYWIEYKLGMRKWNWWHLAGQLVLNAALGAAQGVLFGGPFSKITKLASLAKKAGLGGLALKAVKAVAKGITFFINSIVKSLTRKPGESWGTAAKRWFS